MKIFIGFLSFLLTFVFLINPVNAYTDNSEIDCDDYAEPILFLQSPNGGEEYKEGQKVTVEWDSCNLPQKAKISLNIQNINTGHSYTLLNKDLNYFPNTGKAKVTLPDREFWEEKIVLSQMEFGEVYRLSIGAMSPYKDSTSPDSTDGNFSINKKTTKKKAPVFKKCFAGDDAGTFTLDSSSSPESFTYEAGQFVESENTANILLKNGSEDVCVNGLQIAISANPKKKISKVEVFDIEGKLQAKVVASEFKKTKGQKFYTAWVPVKIPILANEEKYFIFMTHLLPESKIKNGAFETGFTGLNFSSPGASGKASSFGNKIIVE